MGRHLLSLNFVTPVVRILFDAFAEPLRVGAHQLAPSIEGQLGWTVRLEITTPFGHRMDPDEHSHDLSAFRYLLSSGS
jgi:hypothetical protein